MAPGSTTGEKLSTERPRRRHRWLLWTGAVLVLFGAIVWTILIHDDPQPDDADMTPQWTGPALDADNPLARFCADVLRIYPKGVYVSGKRRQLQEAKAQLDEMDGVAKAKEFISQNGDALAAMHQLLASKGTIWCWPDSGSIADDSRMPYLSRIQFVAEVQSLAAQVHAKEGELEKAVLASLDLHHLGRIMQAAKGSSIQHLVAVSAQSMAELALERALARSAASPALLRQGIEGIALDAPLIRDAVVCALQLEYQEFKSMVTSPGVRARFVSFHQMNSAGARLATVLFKPNQTLNHYLALARPLIAGVSKGWAQASIALRNARDLHRQTLQWQESWSFFLNPNRGGIIEANIAFQTPDGIVSNAVNRHMQTQQRIIIMALRLFELEKGRLPQVLDELVPAFLPEVPQDPHSGKPMLWNAAAQAVYSVGPDRRDDGGRNPLKACCSEHYRGSDHGMEYWWKSSP